MQFVVLGSTGMVGSGVLAYFKSVGAEVITINRDRFDAASGDMAPLEKLIPAESVVVNCIGIIPRAMDTAAIMLAVNAVFPRNLSILCRKRKAKLFHISTDCVFSGDRPDGRYTIDDYCDATGLYGLTKFAGEPPDCLTLRTSVVGEEPSGRARSLLGWAMSQKGKTVDGYTNHIWNGLTSTHLAKVIEGIAESGSYHPGTHIVHSPRAVSKYELLGIFNDVYDLGLTIRPSKNREGVNRSLSSNDLYLGFCDMDIRGQVEEMKGVFERGR